MWEGGNSSSGGGAEGPSRSVSHAASLDAISKRAVKQETARAPCRSLTCSVRKYFNAHRIIYYSLLLRVTCRDLSDLALALSVERCFTLWPTICIRLPFSCVSVMVGGILAEMCISARLVKTIKLNEILLQKTLEKIYRGKLPLIKRCLDCSRFRRREYYNIVPFGRGFNNCHLL